MGTNADFWVLSGGRNTQGHIRKLFVPKNNFTTKVKQSKLGLVEPLGYDAKGAALRFLRPARLPQQVRERRCSNVSFVFPVCVKIRVCVQVCDLGGGGLASVWTRCWLYKCVLWSVLG